MVGRGGRIVFFFFNDTATTEIYTLSYTTLFRSRLAAHAAHDVVADGEVLEAATGAVAIVACADRSEEHTSELQSQSNLVCRLLLEKKNYSLRQPCKSEPCRLLVSHCGVDATCPQ